MKNISTCLWFDNQVEEAFALYSTVFQDVKKLSSTNHTVGTASRTGQTVGSVMTLKFEIEGYKFLGMNGGPRFQMNPSISFYVSCTSEAEVDERFEKLSNGGRVLMPLNKYPFSARYGWVIDKFGVPWQLNFVEDAAPIIPAIMYTGEQNGKAEEAMKYYTSIFKNSEILELHRYLEGEGNIEGLVKHAKFSLDGQKIIAMDGGASPPSQFNEALSQVVSCETQSEIDEFWTKLSKDGQPGQCGWLKDKYGVWWQIVPGVLAHLMDGVDETCTRNVAEAMMTMTKLDIEKLQAAAAGVR